MPERQAEYRHDRVADDLLDCSAVRLEHRPHDVEVAVQDLAQCLRVQSLAKGRGALEVGGDEGDDAANFVRRPHPGEATRRTSRRDVHRPGSSRRRFCTFARPRTQSSGGSRPIRWASGLGARGAFGSAAPQVAKGALVRPGQADEVGRRCRAPEALVKLGVDERSPAPGSGGVPPARPSGPREGPSAHRR